MVRHLHRPRTLVGLGLALIASTGLALAACELEAPRPFDERHAGAAELSITVDNGGARPMRMALGGYFFINELVIQRTEQHFPDTDIVDWISKHGDFAHLDWGDTESIKVDWIVEPGEATETRYISGSPWMNDKHAFTVEWVDETDNIVAGPISFSSDDYVAVRPVAFQWNHSPVAGGYGGQMGNYGGMDVASGGAFAGTEDDIYVVEVAGAGLADGTALVSVHSVLGDSLEDPIPVISGAPIDLGLNGAQIIFTDASGAIELVEGDKWLVRCFIAQDEETPAEVGAPYAGPAAEFNIGAELRLWVAREQVEDFQLPETTRGLRIRWSHRDEPYFIPIEPIEDPQVTYGLQTDLQMSPPANSAFYVAGETIKVTMNLLDNAGNLLHPPDSFGTYGEFVQHRNNGIQMYPLSTRHECIPIYGECGLLFLRAGIWGPLHRVKQNYTEEHAHDWFAYEENFPVMGWVFGGFGNPALWERPITNGFEIEIPEDAFPGTYMLVGKASRKDMGETRHSGTVLRFQVKSLEKTDFIQEVGNCVVCHIGAATLDRMRHGYNDWRTCKFCHVPPHAGVAGAVTHVIHFYSRLYPQQRNDCTWCHLTPESNARVSRIICSSCHGEIHTGEFGGDVTVPTERCGDTCHVMPPAGHVEFPPQ